MVVTEKIKQFAFRREVIVLLTFGVAVTAGYYFYLKNKKSKAAATAVKTT